MRSNVGLPSIVTPSATVHGFPAGASLAPPVALGSAPGVPLLHAVSARAAMAMPAKAPAILVVRM